jgi:hypothetical protein
MVKSVSRSVLLLLAVLLLVMSAALAWVSNRPRDISRFIPRVEAALASGNAPVHVAIEKAQIDWRQWRNVGRISIENVKLLSTDNILFATLPVIQLQLSPFSLLQGKLAVDWVIIPRTDMVLTNTPERKFMLGFAGSNATIPLAALYASNTSTSSPNSSGIQLPFRHFLIENANITIRDPAGKTLLRTYQSEIALSRESRGFNGAIKLQFRYRDQKGSVEALLRHTQSDNRMTLASKLVNTPVGLFCGFAPDCGYFVGLRGALTGKLSLGMREGAVESADMVMVGKRMKFTNTDWFPEPLRFTEAAVSAEISNDMKQVEIRAIDLKNTDTHIVSSGHAEKKADGWYVSLAATQKGLPLDKLYRYWPVHLAEQTRTWVMHAIKGGVSPEAVATINLTPEDIAAENLPDHVLNATTSLRGTTVRYLPGLAPVRNIDGKVHFTGTTMRADVGGGEFLTDSKLLRAEVSCPDLYNPKVPMQARLEVDAVAGDGAELLTHKVFTFDDGLKLNKKTIVGRVKGTLDLSFNAFGGSVSDEESFDLSGVNYDTDIQFENVGQPQLLGMYDIAGFNGSLSANDKGFTLTGAGNAGTSPLNLSVTQRAGEDVHVGVKGVLSKSGLGALGLPNFPEIGEGTLGVDAGFLMSKQHTALESVVLDMKDVALSIPDISVTKPRAEPLNVTLRPIDTKTSRYALSVEGKSISTSGELQLNAQMRELQSISLAQVKSPKNDFAVNYRKNNDATYVTISGTRLDNSMAYMSDTAPTSEHSILENFPRIALTLDLKELVLSPEMPIRMVKGVLDCASGACTNANISASVGEKGAVSGSIVSLAGKRTLELNASDAGALLKAVDMSDKVTAGTLNFSGIYDSQSVASAISGRLDIDRFNVRQSQILARLFSITSLSGMANLLTGSGIDFDRLRADIRHERGVFTLSNARASGSSIGYTTEGTVDTRSSTLNLKGVLVPAYVFNSIIGKIPLIGAIAGGEGEGLISFNYTVSGKYADPEVSVNPLSGLTPGFLRGIFDMGSEPDTTKKSDATEKSAIKKQ